MDFISSVLSYGDIAPVSIPGRSFAIIWILVGLVITAILTGAITTSLTSSVMASSAKIYGTSVSVHPLNFVSSLHIPTDDTN